MFLGNRTRVRPAPHPTSGGKKNENESVEKHRFPHFRPAERSEESVENVSFPHFDFVFFFCNAVLQGPFAMTILRMYSYVHIHTHRRRFHYPYSTTIEFLGGYGIRFRRVLETQKGLQQAKSFY